MSDNAIQENKICYSKFLSALFSSLSLLALSILCLLNNLSLDLYGAISLFKVTAPGTLSFWILGYIIGKKLDGLNEEIVAKKIVSEQEAYEIPSMFGPEMQENTNENSEINDV